MEVSWYIGKKGENRNVPQQVCGKGGIIPILWQSKLPWLWFQVIMKQIALHIQVALGSQQPSSKYTLEEL